MLCSPPCLLCLSSLLSTAAREVIILVPILCFSARKSEVSQKHHGKHSDESSTNRKLHNGEKKLSRKSSADRSCDRSFEMMPPTPSKKTLSPRQLQKNDSNKSEIAWPHSQWSQRGEDSQTLIYSASMLTLRSPSSCNAARRSCSLPLGTLFPENMDHFLAHSGVSLI